jgi:thiol:disulfide interchange protein DsbD
MFLGFWLTFTFSMGMGIIFLLAGTFSGALSAMPKGGRWMEAVKYFFAILLIGGGLYFLDAVLAVWLITLIWGVFLIAVSVFMGLFNPLRTGEARERIYRILTVLIFLLGALLFIRGVESKFFPTGPSIGPGTGAVETAASLPWNHDLDEARKIAAREKRWLMIDTYADWCAACKELEKHTFATPEVQRELAEFVLVKLDFTARSAANEALRKSLNVIGMPTVIFYGPGGEEAMRFSGFKNKADFLNLLRSLLQ